MPYVLEDFTVERAKQAVTNFLRSGVSNVAKQSITFAGKTAVVSGSGVVVEKVVAPHTSEDFGRLCGLLTGAYVGSKVFGVKKPKVVESKVDIPETSVNEEITGMDWYQYFRETYGKENVCWVTSNPSEVAAAWQGSYPYVGVDDYVNTVLKEGDIILVGEPFPTGYSTTLNGIEGLGDDAQKIFKGLQVKPYYKKGMRYAEYRAKLTPYRVNKNINVAEGVALNNPQFGSGGLEQRFDPNFDFNVANGSLTRLESMTIDLSNTKISLVEYFKMMKSIK